MSIFSFFLDSLVFFLSYWFFICVIDLLSAFVCPVFYQIFDICVAGRRYCVIVCIEVISTFYCIRMDYAELFIKDHSSTSLFCFLLVPISGFHVLP